ncbi:MAG: selenium metabolism-associated LysR family transcriptional regulator [Synergistaceae bacterium]|nr:selenium metabolism-associated LysR family transcriptional regulator [Synergistaceae bacterium]
MEIKQLRSFIAVVKYGSFTKAAEKLYLTQPTVSFHVRTLEEELQTQLLLRNTKSICITEKGRELFETAINIVSLEDMLFKKWQNGGESYIHLGVSTIPSGYLLPKIAPAFCAKYPAVRFIINQSDSSDILNGLVNGLYDIAITGMKTDRNIIEYYPLCEDRLELITPNTEEFRQYETDKFPVEKLLTLPFVLREDGSASGRFASAILESLDLDEAKMNVTAKLNDQESIKNLVAAGVGVSIISSMAADNYIKDGLLLRFSLPSDVKRKFYAARRKNKILSSEAEQFLHFVKTFFVNGQAD